MENVITALQLCLIAQRNLVLLANKPQQCIDNLREVSRDLGITDITEIDLLQCQDNIYENITNQMVIAEEGKQPRLHEITIWRNLESVDLSFECKNSLVQIFNELEKYNTLRSRDHETEPFKLGSYTVAVPELCCVVSVMKSADCLPKLHHHIKERFWFAQYCYLSDTVVELPKFGSNRQDILDSRAAIANVHVHPQIEEYVCSLLVFTRSHRLCLIAPLTTRPTFRALNGIILLAKTLVVLKSAQQKQLYVTPEYVKVAYRKMGYWLVDWETNFLFESEEPDLEYRKKLELTILTGDWYGSEWSCAQQYMFDFASTKDRKLTTGFTNKVVDDVLQSVRPPL